MGHTLNNMMNEESVYCLIPPVINPPPKPPLYRSKYPGVAATDKRCSATMGPLKVSRPTQTPSSSRTLARTTSWPNPPSSNILTHEHANRTHQGGRTGQCRV